MSDKLIRTPDGFYTVKDYVPPTMDPQGLADAIRDLLAPINESQKQRQPIRLVRTKNGFFTPDR